MDGRLGDSGRVAPADLVVDPSLQPRLGGIDLGHVAVLAEDAEAWPPIMVVVRDGKYWVVDGFHRLAAAVQLGLELVEVTVVEWPADSDLRALAFRLNAHHGRPLSLADRKAEALRLLSQAPDRSSRSIGRACGLNHQTVERLRAQAVASGDLRQTETRVGDRSGGYRYSPPARKAGELPEESFGEWVRGGLAALGGREAAAARRSLSYLRRIAVALEDQFALRDWNPTALAQAADQLSEEEEKAKLGERLGAGATNLLRVAGLLGYEGGGD